MSARISAFFIFILISFSGRAQTLFPPDLNCVTSNGTDISLSWIDPVNGCGPFIAYEVYGSFNGGPYGIVATISNQMQTDTTLMGIDSGNWSFYMVSIFNCPGYNPQNSDTLDDLPPIAPLIDFITAYPPGPAGAILQWQPGTDPEIYAYVIYLFLGGQYFAIDTVYGSSTSFDTIPGANTAAGPASYTIAAMDSCGKIGNLNLNPHQTVFLFNLSANCSTTGHLYWTRYRNWLGGVHHYEVFESVNNGAYVRIDSTFDTTATFFYGADNLCFYVVAYDDTGATSFISMSNIICIPPNPDAPVADFYVRNVTVASPGVVNIFFSMNPNSDVRSLKISRCTDGVSFADIAVVSVPSNLNAINLFSDSSALTSDYSYYYRFTSIDSCGADTVSSSGKSILLTGNSYSTLKNHIDWSDFFYLQYGDVQSYTILRRTPGGAYIFVDSVNASTLSYEEDVTDLVTESNGTLCYKIIATDTVHFPNGIIDTVRSESNEVCIDQLLKIMVPNAFAPNGKNNIFKPVLRFADNKSYLFQVYNRWGGIIFSTTDFNEGWDGDYKGRPSEQGVYAYLVQVVDGQGRNTERKGTVMLLR